MDLYSIQLDHAEIRFNVLHCLYQKHYSDQLSKPQMTDKIIEEAGLKEIDKNLVYGDIIYLQKMALIKGQKYLVPNYPYTINITNIGIDKVEAIAYQFNYNIENSANVDQKTKTQIRKIFKESGPSSKIAAVLGYVKKYPEPFENILESLLRFFLPQ